VEFKNVGVIKKANVYHDGRVTSRTIVLPGGQKKTLGVMLPGTYRFNTDAPEQMDVTQGRCKVQVAGTAAAQEYRAGESFNVPGKTHFDIEVLELLDYVCHFE
jgi:purine/pyrimidine-nucleoside phosphorylase